MFRNISNRWRRINVCKFPSEKNGQNIWTESIGELCLAMFCERDRNVVRYSTQPVRIHYYLDGKQRSYTPDFLIYRKVGRPLIVEFKYERQITAWFDQLFRIVTPICDRAGFDFEVKTERHILVEPLLTTEKRLRYYSRTPIHPHHQLLANEFLSKRNAATLGEMFDFFEVRGSERTVVLALLYHNFILTDYSLPLGLNSPIWVASTGNNEGGRV